LARAFSITSTISSRTSSFGMPLSSVSRAVHRLDSWGAISGAETSREQQHGNRSRHDELVAEVTDAEELRAETEQRSVRELL
jgi:hypothetical protein